MEMTGLTRSLLAALVLSLGWRPVAAEEVLTWGDCLVEARKNNPQLISAAEGVNREKAGKDAVASALYPQVTSRVSASTTMQTSRDADTGDKTSSAADSYSYGVTGSQLLFDGFKTVNEVRSAGQSVMAAQEGYRFTSSQVRFNLRAAFINLLRSQELVRVAEEIRKIRRDSLVLIALRHHSGLEHRGALMTAEANAAGADLELAQAKREIGLAQRQLVKEMGREEFVPFSVEGDFAVKDKAGEKPDFEEIVKENPSLLQAVARKNAASFDVKSAYGDFSPQLSADIGVDRSGAPWPPRDKDWGGGVSLTLPLFEGGLKVAQVSGAEASYRQAEADEKDIKDSAVVNLEQTWKVLQDAMGAVEVERLTLEAAAERAKIAQAQYSTGFIAFDDWIIIQDNLVTAKRRYLNAQATALLAEADWIQAKGETLEYAN